MSRKKTPNRRPIAPPKAAPAEAIPDAVVYAAQHMEANVAARKEGRSMHIDLEGAAYRTLSNFEVAGSMIQVGAIDRARPRLNERRVQQAFAFGHLLGSQALFTTVRLDRATGTLLPVTVSTHAATANGHLVYLPGGRAIFNDGADQRTVNAFTTSAFILEPGEPSVSFVTSDDSIKAAERAMAAGTEIMQNRFNVHAITLADGSTHTSERICQTFQESFANGAGNMLGAISLGWTYRQYDEFLANRYDTTPMHANFTERKLLRHGRTEVIAPHVMFDRDTYSAVADGGLPDGPIAVIARTPLPLSKGYLPNN